MRGQVAAQMDHLRSLGVRVGDRVVLCLPKSTGTVCAYLACITMGAVAVPVDPRQPLARLASTIEHLEPAVIFAEPDRFEALPGAPWHTLDYPLPAAELSALHDHQSQDPALILLSSGTTGVPKAIEITHGNLGAFSHWAREAFAVSAEDSILAVAPLYFDLSVFDVLVGLAARAHVHLLSEIEASFPAQILTAARQEASTILYTVPTVLQMIQRLTAIDMPDLRWLLIAGEVLPETTLRRLPDMVPNARLANLYGPTETNVVSWQEVYPTSAFPLPIGRSCAGARVWIADDEGAELRAGKVGEICVEGPSVSPGYWREPVKSEKARVEGKLRTHRSGDLGWQTTDGVTYITGRRDRHVKLRGVLVNLEEIEALAVQSGVISAAAAILENAGQLNARIEIFVVPIQPNTYSPESVLRHLSERLPKALVPSHVWIIDGFPQLPNGKLDHSKLKFLTLGGER